MHLLGKLRQQRGLKVDLAYVTSALAEINLSSVASGIYNDVTM
jgi:hypothetical protein